jgi:hypothetical protein
VENSRSPVNRQISRRSRGSYNKYSQRVQAQERQNRRSKSTRVVGFYTWISISGIRRLESRNLCNETREITKRKVPKGQKDHVGQRSQQGG